MREAHYRTLKSGLNLCVVPFASPLKQVQLFTPFGGDVLQYSDGGKVVQLQPGSAHYFEHVLFFMPPLEKGGILRDGLTELEKNKAIEVNAYTTNDHTNYYFVTRLNLEQNLEILLDFVLTPYLPLDKFKSEVGTILSEAKQGRNDADEVQQNRWNEQAFQVHGARFPVVGTLESIPKISLEDVLSMHSVFYRPSNMTLVVTGNVDPEAIARTVERKLDELGIGEYIVPPVEVYQAEPSYVIVPDNFDNPIRRADVVRPNVLGGWKYLIDPAQDTMDDHIIAEFIEYALFGDGSRSMEQLIEAGMDRRTFSGDSSTCRDYIVVSMEGDIDDPYRFSELIQNTAQRLIRDGISKEEIEYARNSLFADFNPDRTTIEGFSDQLAEWGVLTRNPLDYFRALKRYEAMSAKEVNDALPRFLDPKQLTFVAMMPER